MDNLEQAYQTYLKRQSREEHPDGEFDNGGRWYPSDKEEQKCCSSIRTPSRSFPYSRLVHCRTADHIARLYGLEPKELKSYLAKRRGPAKREGGDDYYKLVAQTDDGRLVSVYDGETEYKVGEPVQQRARQNHKGGIYVYSDRDQAEKAAFPKDSALLGAVKKLLRVRAEGQYTRYDNKLAFSKVTPLEVVDENR